MLENFRANVLKAGVNMNLSEILGSLKREKKGKKWLWNTTRQLPDPTITPGCWATVWCVSTNF